METHVPCLCSIGLPGLPSSRVGWNTGSQSTSSSTRIVGLFARVSICTSIRWAFLLPLVLEKMRVDVPVVSCPYMPAALMPMPCCPRDMRSRWNLEPYSSFAKILGICWRTMPGPLSVMLTRKRSSAVCWMATPISGRMPASSHASRELSTASFTVVSSALRGLSNPSRWRFFRKNSDTEISRCFSAMLSAVSAAATFFEFLAMVLLENEGPTYPQTACGATGKRSRSVLQNA